MPLVDFGQPQWFDRLDSHRRFFWDRAAADLLTGPDGLDLRAGLLVADFGCGWGYLGHLMLPSLSPSGRVDGFDLSEELLDTARKRAKEVGTRQLRFELGWLGLNRVCAEPQGVAKREDLVDGFGVDAGALDGSADGDPTERRGRGATEGAAELADRGAGRRDEVDGWTGSDG